MRILALISFYDEQPADFRLTILSLAGFVDAVLVLDGAYKDWPDGRPASPGWQIEALGDVCAEAKLPFHYWAPPVVWEHNDLGKRQALMDFARDVGGDWVLVIDADEMIVTHGMSRPRLIRTDLDVASISRCGISPFAADRATGAQPLLAARNLMRLTPGLTLEVAHGMYRNERGCLWNPDDAEALDLTKELLLYHFPRSNADQREAARAAYYERETG